MQKTYNYSKTYVQLKDNEKSIINLVELREDARRIYQQDNTPYIIVVYKSGVVIHLGYLHIADRDSDMRRITYLLGVRKAPGRPSKSNTLD